jgi:hypothetical protein
VHSILVNPQKKPKLRSKLLDNNRLFHQFHQQRKKEEKKTFVGFRFVNNGKAAGRY